ASITPSRRPRARRRYRRGWCRPRRSEPGTQARTSTAPFEMLRFTPMNLINRTLELDADTDARLQAMAKERGQDVAAVLAEAVALLDSVVDIGGPDVAEDRRRYDEFRQTGAAVPLGDVKAWVASWGSGNEI